MEQQNEVEAMLGLGDPPVKVDLAFMHHLMQTNADMRLQLERLQESHQANILLNQLGEPVRLLSFLNGMASQYAPGIAGTQAISFAAEEATIAILQTITNAYINYDKVHKK
jgi:hypothetical protein